MATDHGTRPGPRFQDITGQRFGRLTVVEVAERRKKPKATIVIWRCRCDCGGEARTTRANLIGGWTRSCGCLARESRAAEMNRRRIDITGQTFGRLTALRLVEVRGRYRTERWECSCSCGGSTVTAKHSLLHGSTQSCGCIRREQGHGQTGTPEYLAWQAMRQRCGNNTDYTGVKVCERWQDFTTFLADMGPKPSPKHSLDRIDPAGDYCPENCRWAARDVQSRNTRRTRFITWNGRTQPLSDWAKEIGISAGALDYRLGKGGWSLDEALTTPSDGRLPIASRRKPRPRTGKAITRCPEYSVWHAMKRRCRIVAGYQHVTVCDRWAGSFQHFLADMGPRPTPDHSLDRIDNSKGYGPDNCRWATRAEQARNTTRNRFITYNGKTQTQSEWARELGVPPATICQRLKAGMPLPVVLQSQRLPTNGSRIV